MRAAYTIEQEGCGEEKDELVENGQPKQKDGTLVGQLSAGASS